MKWQEGTSEDRGEEFIWDGRFILGVCVKDSPLIAPFRLLVWPLIPRARTRIRRRHKQLVSPRPTLQIRLEPIPTSRRLTPQYRRNTVHHPR